MSAVYRADSPSASRSGYWARVLDQAIRIRLREMATPSEILWFNAAGELGDLPWEVLLGAAAQLGLRPERRRDAEQDRGQASPREPHSVASHRLARSSALRHPVSSCLRCADFIAGVKRRSTCHCAAICCWSFQ